MTLIITYTGKIHVYSEYSLPLMGELGHLSQIGGWGFRNVHRRYLWQTGWSPWHSLTEQWQDWRKLYLKVGPMRGTTVPPTRFRIGIFAMRSPWLMGSYSKERTWQYPWKCKKEMMMQILLFWRAERFTQKWPKTTHKHAISNKILITAWVVALLFGTARVVFVPSCLLRAL